jgi:sialate O-acetylesterase
VNGVRVGTTAVWNVNRNYKIPARLLKPGKNSIAVRCLDTGQMGGLCGRPEILKLVGPGKAISLAGNWLFRSTCGSSPDISNLVHKSSGPGRPSVLNNAMIAPLQQFPIKGTIWYQGESNVERAAQYRQLFTFLIADWRNKWKQPNMPFLFVQVAPFRGLTPELREAQWLTQRSVPNTAMAVITDAGDAGDIHPAEKRIPGQRLALAARALAYHEKIEYSGPTFQNAKFSKGEAILTFGHADSGLVARGGPLTGFTIAGKDGRFVVAKAEIKGKTVRVWSDAVPKPTAVRYGWANVPVVNLYNGAALPASPFRTDMAAIK